MSTTTPSLAEVIKKAIGAHTSGFFTATIARVLSYDATKHKADLQPIMTERVKTETGELVERELPVLVDVPMVSGTNHFVKFPIAVDDTVLVVFLSQDADQWLIKGGKTMNPEDDRRNVLSSAAFIPGLQSFKNAHEQAIQLVFTTSLLMLGAGAVDFALKGDTFLTHFNTLINAIATAVGGIPGGAAAGTAITTALGVFNGNVGLYKSTKVKVE